VDIRFSSRLGWPAPGNSLAALREWRRDRGLPVLDFSESNPTKVGLTRTRLDNFSDPENLSYEPNPKGLLRAREALAAEYAGRFGDKAPRPDDLFLCSSTSEAYGWLFKLLCDPGDAVLVPKPGYPLFEYLAGLEAVEARPYRLDYIHPHGWRIDLDSVRASLEGGRAKALVAINPNNPTGSYIRGDEKEALVALCRRFSCALISDEVFFGFPVEGVAAGNASFLGEGELLCFVLDGLSKRLGMPQAKLGWIAASGPGPQLDEARGRLEIIADAYLSAGTPIMNALPSLLSEADAFSRPCRERLGANLASLRGILEGPYSPHRVLSCEGGWTAIIESPRFLPEEELALGLLREKGLWTHPGYFFDMEREAFFTVGLILPPKLLEVGALAFADFFAGLQG
jgi:aspartate/methionine/tyrosine aminotransferase